MCFKSNMKCMGSMCLRTSSMLGMDSTPGSTTPEKSIDITTSIQNSKHNLIRSRSRITCKSYPVADTSGLRIIEQSRSAESRARVSAIILIRGGSIEPHKECISRGRLIGDIDGFLGSYGSGSIPDSRSTHIVPGTPGPSHTVDIYVRINQYHSKLIATRFAREFYIARSSRRWNIDISRPCPAGTIPDMIIGVSSAITRDDDEITGAILVFDIKSSIEGLSVSASCGIIECIEELNTSP